MINSAVKAFIDLFRPRILFLVIGVPLLAVGLWGISGFLLFPWMQSGLQSLLVAWNVESFFNETFGSLAAESLGSGILLVILLILLLPLIYWTSLILLSTLALPWIIRTLKPRYPALQQLGQGMGAVAGWAIMFRVFMIAVPLYILLLMLIWLPPVFPVGTFILGAWVNSYFLSLEILSEMVDRKTMTKLMKKHRVSIWLMGAALMFLLGVPFLQLITPVFAGLWFTHWWLATLSEELPSIKSDQI